ncbi:hypothetical protein BOSP111201_10345 [Bordetella sputigena]|uniref:hypothetical protein n=1 Tax=Bordetella sputigena TaxID=1416810 RepID=UPI0039EDF0FC
MQTGGAGRSDPGVNGIDNLTPPRPPERERDDLDGLLTATLFPRVKAHRPRIIDMLRVIQATQTGRELLHDFRMLAERGRYPTIELADGRDTSRKEAEKPHCLCLAKDMLTAGASTIGLAPEVEHAPSMLMRLAQIRNALAERSAESRYTTSPTTVLEVWMDPVATVVNLRNELEVHRPFPRAGEDAPGRRDSVSTPLIANRDASSVDMPIVAGRDKAFFCLPLRKDSASPYKPVVAPEIDTTETQGPGKTRLVFRWAAQQAQKFGSFIGRRAVAEDTPPRGGPATLKEAKLGHRRTPSIIDMEQVRRPDEGTGISTQGTRNNGE